MTAVSRSFTLLCLSFLLLASCTSTSTSVRRDLVDPTFQAQGLKGGVVSLKCITQTNKPYGLAPQDEREILEDVRRGILAAEKDVQILPTTSANAGDIKPTHIFEVNVTHDHTEQKAKYSRTIRRVNPTTGVYVYVTKTRVRRHVSVTYTLTHQASGRRVWQASGDTTHSASYEIILIAELRPELQPNQGPPLSELLRPVTRKACGKLP